MADNPVTDDNNVVLYDDLGNKVGVVLDNGIYRLESRATISSPNGVKDVDVITDGSVERLAVDANVTGGVNQEKFSPEFDYSLANTALNTSTDTSLFTETAEGKISFISIDGSNANFEIVLKIDTVEVLRIAMADLATLGLSNATNVPIWAELANKNFRYNPTEDVDHATSWEILAKATATPTPTANWLVTHRNVI
jgi:hypothetical protein